MVADQRCQHLETMEVLLAANAAINQTDANGMTPLAEAIIDSNVESVQILLTHGARLNPDALTIAARIGHPHVIHLIVSALDPSEIDRPDSKGTTALMIASRAGHLAATKILLDAGAQPDLNDIHGR